MAVAKTTHKNTPGQRAFRNRPQQLIYSRGNMHGAALFDKVLRERIYGSVFWKEHLLVDVDAESVLDVAVQLDCVGGTHGLGAPRPTPFLCLLLKLAELAPSPLVLAEYLAQRTWKYVEALALAYVRLAAPPAVVYALAEARLGDWRRLRMRLSDGRYVLTWMDAFADGLLAGSRVLDAVPAPRLPKRALVRAGMVAPLPLGHPFRALLPSRAEGALGDIGDRPTFGVFLDEPDSDSDATSSVSGDM